MARNVIAVKNGTKDYNVEGFVDLDTGRTEDVDWDDGPSNEFYNACGASGAGKGDKERPMNRRKYEDNYDKINWGHGKEQDGKKEQEEAA